MKSRAKQVEKWKLIELRGIEFTIISLVQLQLGYRFPARSRQLRQPSSQCFWQEKRALSEIAFTCGHDWLQCLLRRRPEKHFISTTRHKLKSIHKEIFTLYKGLNIPSSHLSMPSAVLTSCPFFFFSSCLCSSGHRFVRSGRPGHPLPLQAAQPLSMLVIAAFASSARGPLLQAASLPWPWQLH